MIIPSCRKFFTTCKHACLIYQKNRSIRSLSLNKLYIHNIIKPIVFDTTAKVKRSSTSPLSALSASPPTVLSAKKKMAPLMPPDIKIILEQNIKDNAVMIFSKSYCPFCKKVKDMFDSLNVKYHALELDKDANGQALQDGLGEMTSQKTVPNVFIKGKHIGGADATLKAQEQGNILPLLEDEATSYDYDLFVIGGGSGGLSCSKEAAVLGMKVAVCDFVKPTPKGTKWGIGGTCVNVGCIPKKLMHQAALLGEALQDAKKFGWEFSDQVQHNWETMRMAVQNHIGSLNFGYRVQLQEQKVKYFNKFAEFVDPHTVKLVDKKGKEQIVTSKNFVLATGERPRYPKIPGAQEYCITSDDLFSLPYCPGKTLVIGASYVALECAGFLKGIGLDVTVMVRSILLRGFDQDMAERIGQYMQDHGIRFLKRHVPNKIEMIEEGSPGRLKVTFVSTDGGEEISEEFNTVLLGIGRDACTQGIGLEKVGVQINKNGMVIADDCEQTTVPHVYAIGDILDGKPELTPVAIQAGKLLARRMFGGSKEKCDYINVPTTVFTPLEYGACGYSEEDANAKFGEENIETYLTNFQPLEYTVAERENNACYAKLVCNKADNEKVVGFHVLGPNAGEVTQGFAIGLKMGATKADFDGLIGIHPTNAEVFTTLNITRSSGESTEQSGC